MYLIIIILIVVIVYYILIARFWLKCLILGIKITQLDIIFMRLRKSPVNLILTELIKAHKSEIPVSKDELEACYLGDGEVKNVVDGLIYAKTKGIDLTFKEAAHLDQQKRDIVIYLRNK